MKNNNTNQPPKQRPTGAVRGTYKPRTPITKTTIKIMNDPFVFSV